jgi:hypothetical protein
VAFYTCTVNEAGPAADGTETAAPVIYINLSDQSATPAFTGQWFYASENSRSEMLAVALAAITTGNSAEVAATPPNVGGTPYTEITRLYLIGS